MHALRSRISRERKREREREREKEREREREKEREREREGEREGEGEGERERERAQLSFRNKVSFQIPPAGNAFLYVQLLSPCMRVLRLQTSIHLQVTPNNPVMRRAAFS